MAVTGVVQSVTPVTYGDALSVDVEVGDTVLPLSSAIAFEEEFTEPRWLVIGDESTPREYVSPTQNDPASQQSVTLAVPLDADFEAGLPVTLWDSDAPAEDKRATDVKAWVRLDSAPEGNPIRVTVRHNAQPTAGDYALKGANVELVQDESGEWWIGEVLGRTAVLDGSTIDPATLPASSSGQTFSEDAPSSTDGFAEGHVWWQVVDGERVGTWHLESGAWEPVEVVSAVAAEFQAAVIGALQVTGLEAVSMTGGSIFIAQGEEESISESFSGTSLPSGWTATKTDNQGFAPASSTDVPGASVVSSGPSGQVGSALLIDYGAAGRSDIAMDIGGEVLTDLSESANALISIRYRLAESGVSNADDTRLAVRRQDGNAWSSTMDAITLKLHSGFSGHSLAAVIDGTSDELASIAVTTDPATDWHWAQLRVSQGAISARIWRDGDSEPVWTTVPQANPLTPGAASLIWRRPVFTFDSTRGQKVWVDQWDATNFATGFSVNADGTGEWPGLSDDSGLVAATGSFTGGFRFVRVGKSVMVEGYVDRDDDFGTSEVNTGVVIPENKRPASLVLTSGFAGYGTTNQYRFRFKTDGTVTVQRTGVITTQMAYSGVYFVD